MPLAVYRKMSRTVPVKETVKKQQRAPHENSQRVPLFPMAMMILGALLVGSVTGPIVAYLTITAPRLRANAPLISPLVEDNAPTFTSLALAAPLVAAPIVYDQLDYSRPENWFPGAPLPKPNPAKDAQYTISIPEIGIDNAIVDMAGEDLQKSLIQYPGTANPGDLGSPVIFGHSILRQFYNPKSYMSIFSTIMTLKSGDKMYITYNGVQYVYRVIDKMEVKPTDIQILQQKYSGRYIKLVTCVPEGTYLRRGIVIGQLE